MARRSRTDDPFRDDIERVLHSPDLNDRCSAASSLGSAGAAARPALPALREAMRTGPALLAAQAATAILRIAPRERTAVEYLLGALRHPDLGIRSTALDGVVYASGAERLVPALLTCLTDPDPDQRAGTLGRLKRLAPRAAGRSMELAEAVARTLAADPSTDVRHTALRFFEALPRPVRVIGIRALRAAMEQDPDHDVRESAHAALLRLAHEEPAAVRELIQMLAQGSDRSRYLGAKGLAELGRKAKVALPELIAALESNDYWVWSYAAMALGGLGRAARRALPALERLVVRKTAEGLYADEPKEAIRQIRGEE
jgi:HEAT repeat protein